MKNNKSLWNQEIDPGYYDKALTRGINLGRGIRAAWHDRTFNHVLNNINYSSKNLDYACGSGSFLGLYFKNNSIGFDISEKQIQHAKSKYSNKDVNFTTDINVVKKSAPYESITLLGLLEFLDHEDSVNLLNELYDLLEDNGVLIITTPNYKFTMKLLLKLINKFGRVNYQDITINMHTYKSLNKLLVGYKKQLDAINQLTEIYKYRKLNGIPIPEERDMDIQLFFQLKNVTATLIEEHKILRSEINEVLS